LDLHIFSLHENIWNKINHINLGACCINKQVINYTTVSYCINHRAIYDMFWLKQIPANIKSSKNISFEDSVVKKVHI